MALTNKIFLVVVVSISPNIREGLLEVFYGVYEKEADKVSFWTKNIKFEVAACLSM